MRYRVDLMPKSYRNRPGYTLKSTSLTQHNTANLNATAANHANYLKSQARSASWHISVDDVEAVLHIPLNEQAWHTGTRAGNTTSIGIETCEFSNRARQDKADDNTQRLIADMLTGRAPAAFRATHLKIESVRTHQSWSGKYCPRMIIPWWNRFILEIRNLIAPVKPAPVVVGGVLDVNIDCAFAIVTASDVNLKTAESIAARRGLWASRVTPGDLWIHARHGNPLNQLLDELYHYAAFKGNIKLVPTYLGSFKDIRQK